MIHIKKFENFSKDGIDVDNQTLPEFNASKQHDAKEYVEMVFNSGAGPEVVAMCKEIGVNMPQDDESLDKAKEIAIKYYNKNPERIKQLGGGSLKRYDYGSSDRIARTNNVGGALRESVKPGPEEDGSVRIEITPDEKKLFGTESLLIKLVSTDKIALYQNEVWYDENDEATKKVLDIFFDI